MPIIGHKKQRDYLDKGLRSDELFPVMIFHGPSGIGKKQVALELVKKNFCDTQNACENCVRCKKIENFEFENLFYIKPDGKFIKIEAIRELIRQLSLQSISGKRFVIIETCEKLNLQAANALLKTLEEPPSNTYFILITSNLNSIIETIRSRSVAIPFTNLEIDEMKDIIGDAPQWMLNASQGRPGLFMDLKESEALEDRKLALEILETCFQNSRYNAFQKIKSWLQTSPDWDRVFFFMQSLIRDMQIISINEKNVMNTDQINFIKKCSGLHHDFLDPWFQSSIQLQNQFMANQDKNLCLESFWLETKNRYDRLQA